MVPRVAVDSPPPPPPPPPAYVYPAAASDQRPRTAQERKLCDKASSPDWLYLGAGVVLTAGALALDVVDRTSSATSEGTRYLGPMGVGLTWGFLLGGAYLALPKCAPDYVTAPPPEGSVRTDWEIAVVFAALAGLTAPVLEAVETGTVPTQWSTGERAMRLILASVFGAAGAFVPYVLPPQTWRAAKELEHLRASPTADGHGAFVSWGIRF